MPERVKLVSFATPNFRTQQFLLEESAKECRNISAVASWSNSDIYNTKFYQDNLVILREKRGAGLWLWKPYIILEELEKQDDSEFVLYYDVGRARGNRLPTDLTLLVDWAVKQGVGAVLGVYIPEYGPNSRWLKRDAFVLTGCDTDEYVRAPQISATFSLWKKNNECREFVSSWLSLCRDRRVLSDEDNVCGLPNYDGFIEHRHDQSILTLLCMKAKLSAIGSVS
jgi:hypothetical protein